MLFLNSVDKNVLIRFEKIVSTTKSVNIASCSHLKTPSMFWYPSVFTNIVCLKKPDH